MQGPTMANEWQVAIHRAHDALGINDNPRLRHMHHMFLNVGDIAEAAPPPWPISIVATA